MLTSQPENYPLESAKATSPEDQISRTITDLQTATLKEVIEAISMIKRSKDANTPPHIFLQEILHRETRPEIFEGILQNRFRLCLDQATIADIRARLQKTGVDIAVNSTSITPISTKIKIVDTLSPEFSALHEQAATPENIGNLLPVSIQLLKTLSGKYYGVPLTKLQDAKKARSYIYLTNQALEKTGSKIRIDIRKEIAIISHADKGIELPKQEIEKEHIAKPEKPQTKSFLERIKTLALPKETMIILQVLAESKQPLTSNQLTASPLVKEKNCDIIWRKFYSPEIQEILATIGLRIERVQISTYVSNKVQMKNGFRLIEIGSAPLPLTKKIQERILVFLKTLKETPQIIQIIEILTKENHPLSANQIGERMSIKIDARGIGKNIQKVSTILSNLGLEIHKTTDITNKYQIIEPKQFNEEPRTKSPENHTPESAQETMGILEKILTLDLSKVTIEILEILAKKKEKDGEPLTSRQIAKDPMTGNKNPNMIGHEISSKRTESELAKIGLKINLVRNVKETDSQQRSNGFLLVEIVEDTPPPLTETDKKIIQTFCETLGEQNIERQIILALLKATTSLTAKQIKSDTNANFSTQNIGSTINRTLNKMLTPLGFEIHISTTRTNTNESTFLTSIYQIRRIKSQTKAQEPQPAEEMTTTPEQEPPAIPQLSGTVDKETAAVIDTLGDFLVTADAEIDTLTEEGTTTIATLGHLLVEADTEIDTLTQEKQRIEQLLDTANKRIKQAETQSATMKERTARALFRISGQKPQEQSTEETIKEISFTERLERAIQDRKLRLSAHSKEKATKILLTMAQEFDKYRRPLDPSMIADLTQDPTISTDTVGQTFRSQQTKSALESLGIYLQRRKINYPHPKTLYLFTTTPEKEIETNYEEIRQIIEKAKENSEIAMDENMSAILEVLLLTGDNELFVSDILEHLPKTSPQTIGERIHQLKKELEKIGITIIIKGKNKKTPSGSTGIYNTFKLAKLQTQTLPEIDPTPLDIDELLELATQERRKMERQITTASQTIEELREHKRQTEERITQAETRTRQTEDRATTAESRATTAESRAQTAEAKLAKREARPPREPKVPEEPLLLTRAKTAEREAASLRTQLEEKATALKASNLRATQARETVLRDEVPRLRDEITAELREEMTQKDQAIEELKGENHKLKAKVGRFEKDVSTASKIKEIQSATAETQATTAMLEDLRTMLSEGRQKTEPLPTTQLDELQRTIELLEEELAAEKQKSARLAETNSAPRAISTSPLKTTSEDASLKTRAVQAEKTVEGRDQTIEKLEATIVKLKSQITHLQQSTNAGKIIRLEKELEKWKDKFRRAETESATLLESGARAAILEDKLEQLKTKQKKGKEQPVEKKLEEAEKKIRELEDTIAKLVSLLPDTDDDEGRKEGEKVMKVPRPPSKILDPAKTQIRGLIDYMEQNQNRIPSMESLQDAVIMTLNHLQANRIFTIGNLKKMNTELKTIIKKLETLNNGSHQISALTKILETFEGITAIKDDESFPPERVARITRTVLRIFETIAGRSFLEA